MKVEIGTTVFSPGDCVTFTFSPHTSPRRLASIDVRMGHLLQINDDRYFAGKAWTNFDDCARDLLDSSTLEWVRFSLRFPHSLRDFADTIVGQHMPHLLSMHKVRYALWEPVSRRLSKIIPATLDGMYLVNFADCFFMASHFDYRPSFSTCASVSSLV